ncbi:MAG: divalent cation tolerance protein CutA [Alphaproteobacteria bacterium]|nr:divalent cation tolerance protein CutA [Alphaproteobacteria bacterium]
MAPEEPFMNLSSVYVTTASRSEAIVIGKAVVDLRLAACANIFDGVTSIYR